MAETASTERNPSFDRNYYEAHRRRIALAPAIGSVAINQDSTQGIERRRRHEIIDGIAEAIPGVVNNTRYYKLHNNKLVAENGQPIEELLHNGLQSAIHQASDDNFYAAFGPQRARHEFDEFKQWQAMATGQTQFNSLIVVSPYSQEYANEDTNAKLQQAGQAPESKRSMLRLAHWNGQELSVTTRSIDNTNLDLLKESAASTFGYQYEAQNSTEMLGERIDAVFNFDGAKVMVNEFIGEVDRRVGKILGEECLQGRPVREAYDTQKHVESELQVIDNLMSRGRELAGISTSYEEYNTVWRKELHNHISLIKERMQRRDARHILDVGSAASASGAVAAANGQSYNMCGLIISASSESEVREVLGFESVKNLTGKKVTCPECREKVVIPSNKLKEGRLCCSECKYEVDVCTGQVYRKTQLRKHSADRQAVTQHKETEWQKIKREDNEKKQYQKQERIKLALVRRRQAQQFQIDRQSQRAA